MGFSDQLRFRLLAALSVSAALGSVTLVGCWSSSPTEEQGQAFDSTRRPSCSTGVAGSAALQCVEPGTVVAIGGPNEPVMQFEEKNGCQVPSELEASCSGIVSGPGFVDGECCYWRCPGLVACGRPLVVDGAPRVAPAIQRSDWRMNLEDMDLRSLELNAELAEAWIEDAKAEHASVGSFARFVLDLLAFGAPAELVESASRAMADEIRHARLCFGVASAYAGKELGPGPIELASIAPSKSLASAAVAAVVEGCINETIAALAASARAESAADAGLRSILAGIAHDEAEHAELAWRFVQWAIKTGGDPVRGAVAHALRCNAPTGMDGDRCLAGDEPGWRESFQEAQRVAWSRVILPCARGLLEPARRHAGDGVGSAVLVGGLEQPN